MNSLEGIRRLLRNIRRMEKTVQEGCTSKVITKVNGVEHEHTDRTTIDKVCAAENQRKYYLLETGTS